MYWVRDLLGGNQGCIEIIFWRAVFSAHLLMIHFSDRQLNVGSPVWRWIVVTPASREEALDVSVCLGVFYGPRCSLSTSLGAGMFVRARMLLVRIQVKATRYFEESVDRRGDT
jgi:hypothetical protein